MFADLDLEMGRKGDEKWNIFEQTLLIITMRLLRPDQW